MLSISSSRHSRTLRAPTPAGSSDCTTLQRRFDLFRSVIAHAGDLFERRGQIAVFVQVADDRFGGVANILRKQADAQLGVQMIAQGDRRGQKRLEGGLFDRFRGGTLVAGIQVIVEKGTEVDFVEGVGGGRRFDGIGRGRLRHWLRQRLFGQSGKRFRAQIGRTLAGDAVGVGGVVRDGRFQNLLVGGIGDPLRLQQRAAILPA